MKINENLIGHFINGKEFLDEEYKIDIYNPSTGEILGILCSASDRGADGTTRGGHH